MLGRGKRAQIDKFVVIVLAIILGILFLWALYQAFKRGNFL